jgi:hypothetical protein
MMVIKSVPFAVAQSTAALSHWLWHPSRVAMIRDTMKVTLQT